MPVTGKAHGHYRGVVDADWVDPPLEVWARTNADVALACIAAALADDRARGVDPDETRASLERFLRRLTEAQREIVGAELTQRR
jgi:hypothetical protein